MIRILPDTPIETGTTCADPATQPAGLLDRWVNGAGPAEALALVERAAAQPPAVQVGAEVASWEDLRGTTGLALTAQGRVCHVHPTVGLIWALDAPGQAIGPTDGAYPVRVLALGAIELAEPHERLLAQEVERQAARAVDLAPLTEALAEAGAPAPGWAAKPKSLVAAAARAIRDGHAGTRNWRETVERVAGLLGCHPAAVEAVALSVKTELEALRTVRARLEAEVDRIDTERDQLEAEVASLSGGAVANELARLTAEAREVRQAAGLPDGTHAAVVAEISTGRAVAEAAREEARRRAVTVFGGDLAGALRRMLEADQRAAAAADRGAVLLVDARTAAKALEAERADLRRWHLLRADLAAVLYELGLPGALEQVGTPAFEDAVLRARAAKRALDAAQVAYPSPWSSLGHPGHRAYVDAFADLERALQAAPGGAEAVAAVKGRVGLLQLAAGRLRSLAERPGGRSGTGQRVRDLKG